MVALFNTLGVDAVVFGNHEFDFGPEVTQQAPGRGQISLVGDERTGA